MPILTCHTDSNMYFTKKNDYISCVTQQLLTLLKVDFGLGFDLEFYSQYDYCLPDMFGGLDFPKITQYTNMNSHNSLLPCSKIILKSFRV